MIPIATDLRLRRPPLGNWILIGVNVAVYLLDAALRQGPAAQPSLVEVALPSLNASAPTITEYLTYQFRHGDFLHLSGNMLFLWIFGNAVCDRLGSLNYVVFYLAGGIFAGWTFAASNVHALIGASGAIAAVTAAFLVLFPRVHVTVLFWLIIITTFRLPSMVFIGIKIILWDNLIAPRFGQGMTENVAFSAHLGGYAFGFLVALILLFIRAVPRNQFDLVALWDRWRRRTGLVEDLPFRATARARPIQVEELGSRPLQAPQLSEAEQLREDILDRCSEHDLPEAAQLYERLIALSADQVLPRQAQLDVANQLAQMQRHQIAVQAYEAFLRAYPSAPDVAQVRLLCGLIYRRYLSEPARAVALLERAVDDLTRPAERNLAWQELQAAREASPEPDNPPTSA